MRRLIYLFAILPLLTANEFTLPEDELHLQVALNYQLRAVIHNVSQLMFAAHEHLLDTTGYLSENVTQLRGTNAQEFLRTLQQKFQSDYGPLAAGEKDHPRCAEYHTDDIAKDQALRIHVDTALGSWKQQLFDIYKLLSSARTDLANVETKAYKCSSDYIDRSDLKASINCTTAALREVRNIEATCVGAIFNALKKFRDEHSNILESLHSDVKNHSDVSAAARHQIFLFAQKFCYAPQLLTTDV